MGDELNETGPDLVEVVRAARLRRSVRRGVAATIRPVPGRPRIDDAVVDGHMHIMSGFCAPLRAKPATLLGRDISRKLSMALSLVPGVVGGATRMAAVASRPTRRIAATTVRRARSIRRGSRDLQLLPMVAHPMDMDFAHIDGYRYQEAYERHEIVLASQYWLLVGRVFVAVISAMLCQSRYVRLAQKLGMALLGTDIRTNRGKPYEWTGAIAQDLACEQGDVDKSKHPWLVEAVNKSVTFAEGLLSAAGGDLSAATAASERIATWERVLSNIDGSRLPGASPMSVVGTAVATFRASANAARPHGGYTDCLYSYRRPSAWDDPNPSVITLPITLSSQYETWWEQVEAHTACAAKYPWQVVPMYHYDPRRYHQDPAKPFYWLVHAFDSPAGDGSTAKATGVLAEAFRGFMVEGRPYAVSAPPGRGPFIGFKMYPPLGYRPCDFTRLPHLKRFYQACEKLEVPVLAHCNPGGFKISERHLFMDYDRAMQEQAGQSDPFMASQRLGDGESNMGAAGRTFGDYAERMGYAAAKRVSAKRGRRRYFSDEYVSPEGWAKVLREVPDLRLCLAHFGSNETPTGRLASGAQRIAFCREELDSVEEQIRAHEDVQIGRRTAGEEEKLQALRRQAQEYRDRIGRIERYLERKARGRRGKPGARDIPPPPNSGWEYLITEDWVEKSRRSLGLSGEAAALWQRFPLWNRQIIALICTHQHVYTDISYFFLADRQFDGARMALREKHQARFRSFYRSFRHALGLCAKLRRRVLFGTDWYMNLNDVYGLWEYYGNVDDVLERLASDLEEQLADPAPSEPHLKTMLTVLNPLRYYRLGQIRRTYTMVLDKHFGVAAEPLQEEDAKVAKLCLLAEQMDPDNQQGDAYRDPCEGCVYRADRRCGLVERMGFDEHGCYKYPETSRERIATVTR